MLYYLEDHVCSLIIKIVSIINTNILDILSLEINRWKWNFFSVSSELKAHFS